MNIELTVSYSEPELRRLDVVVDGEPWYQEIMIVRSGLSKGLSIGEHNLSINIHPAPPEEPKR